MSEAISATHRCERHDERLVRTVHHYEVGFAEARRRERHDC
jgi:hypothetical protein